MSFATKRNSCSIKSWSLSGLAQSAGASPNFIYRQRNVYGVSEMARAWQVLQLLEAGHHVARQPAPLPPDAAQLALFGPSEPHPLLVELERLDVNALSPLEALNRLAAWKQRLEDGA